MNLNEIIEKALAKNASDLFIVAGAPLGMKVKNELIKLDDERLMPEDTRILIENIYTEADRSMNKLLEKGDDDFSFSIAKVARFRANVYTQRSSLAAVLRIVKFEVPEAKSMNVSDSIMRFAKLTKGLVILSGPSGCGKSTTMAMLLEEINKTRKGHIITIDDPIEFLHKHNLSVVTQREIGTDCESTVVALRSALRQSPDVLFVGEMRDLETISLALTAAETGHLVFSTLHTLGASNTIDRIVDVFPSEQQHQVRIQLAMVLQAVISQQLLQTTQDSIVPAFEIMVNNTAIRNQIREGKTHQLSATIRVSKADGMITMDESLKELLDKNLITKEEASLHAFDPESFK